MLRVCLVLVLACLAPALPILAAPSGVRAIDGDTIDLHGQRIRLFGIDAPESAQTCQRDGATWSCGAWASGVLARAMLPGRVSCQAVDRDRFNRTVAVCHADGRDLAQHMVQMGAARAYARYSDRYLGDEAMAKAAKAGLWAGTMLSPEAYRHRPAPPLAGGCAIKGNIGTSGKIFHTPGQRDYEKTRITPSKGEAWFCSAAEARAAGFRAARR